MFDCVDSDSYCLKEVIVHVASHHADRNAGYNERNYGIGVIAQKPGSKWFVTAGEYRNSFSDTSVYAGFGYDFLTAGPFYFRGEALLVTGYQIPVVPVVLPEVGLRVGRFGAAVHFVPAIEIGKVKTSAVYGFSLTARF